MSHTTILLREDIDNVGGRGDIVRVEPVCAQLLASAGNGDARDQGQRQQIEQEREALLKRAAAGEIDRLSAARADGRDRAHL